MKKPKKFVFRIYYDDGDRFVFVEDYVCHDEVELEDYLYNYYHWGTFLIEKYSRKGEYIKSFEECI